MAWVIGIGIFLFMLVKFPKVTLAICGVLIVAVGALFGWSGWDEQARAKKRASVQVTVQYDTARCSPQFPMLITTANNSESRVNSVTIYVQGYKKGYSKNLYKQRYESDKIIEAGQLHTACWAVPKVEYGVSDSQRNANPPSSMVWKVTNSYPTFAKE